MVNLVKIKRAALIIAGAGMVENFTTPVNEEAIVYCYIQSVIQYL